MKYLIVGRAATAPSRSGLIGVSVRKGVIVGRCFPESITSLSHTQAAVVKLMSVRPMSRQTQSSLLLTATILLTLGACVTLVPWSTPMVSDLGYHTVCPFAPYSTATLAFLAGLAWVVRGYMNRQPD